MNDKELNNFAKLAKKVGKYKPKQAPKKPEKAPSAEQLKEVHKLDKRSITIKKSK
ncbi:MAG: hypothetical protein AAF934_03530 [Bacteroidota bacterium]